MQEMGLWACVCHKMGKRAGLVPLDRVFCDVWAYVSCRGYVGIPQSARFAVKQGGNADFAFPMNEHKFVLDRM